MESMNSVKATTQKSEGNLLYIFLMLLSMCNLCSGVGVSFPPVDFDNDNRFLEEVDVKSC